jgi:hypothetical protein
MKWLIQSVGMAALLAIAPAVMAQSTNPSPAQQYQSPPAVAPGTGGISKPGATAEPGTEAGRAVSPSGKVSKDRGPSETRLQGESDVRGRPNTESGVAEQPPAGASTSGSGTSAPAGNESNR